MSGYTHNFIQLQYKPCFCAFFLSKKDSKRENKIKIKLSVMTITDLVDPYL